MSGVGTGPDPVGWTAQLPSLFLISASRFRIAAVVVGAIEEAGISGGVSWLTSSGADTRSGAGDASIATRSTSCGVGTARARPVRIGNIRADRIFVTTAMQICRVVQASKSDM